MSIAISDHYSTSDGLKLIELPAEKSNTGNFSYKKTARSSSTFVKRKKGTLRLFPGNI